MSHNGKHGNGNGTAARMIDVADITVGAGRRNVIDVDSLAESIKDVGLLNPVTVNSRLRLIAGGRRLAAVRSLGWKRIPATVVELADLKAEMAEIDENLFRNDLTVLERGEHLKRRKQIYETLHPETRQGVAGANGKARKGAETPGKSKQTTRVSFAEDAAKKARVSERTIQREVQIAESLGPEVKALIQDTPLADNANELLRLSRVEPKKQAAAVKAIVDGDATTVSQAVRVVERGEKSRELKARAAKTPMPSSIAAPDWRVLTGDCVEHMGRMAHEALRFRLIFADPPYNQGINYGDGAKADRLPDAEYRAWCKLWMGRCADLLTDDGSLWVLISNEWADEFGVILKRELGLHRRAWIKWYESFGVNAANNFNRCSRHLFYMVRDPKRFVFHPEAVNRPSDRQLKYGDKRADPGGKIWDDVWGINPPIARLVDNAAERIPEFPTQLPLALMRPVIACASDVGDDVLDPFNGSASTGAAAVELGRRYTGIDKVAKFVRLSELRLRTVAAERKAS